MRDGLVRKSWCFAIIVLFVGASIVPSVTSGDGLKTSTVMTMQNNTWYVSDSGDNNNNGTNWSNAWRDINYAINHINVSNGDTIRVGDGKYSEHVIVDKVLDIRGNGSSVTTIDGGGVGDVVQIRDVNGVNISGFNITNSGSDDTDAGIHIYSSENNVNDTLITKNSYSGIIIDGDNNRIRHNIITFNIKDGIWVTEVSDSTIIENNWITDNVDGIRITGTATDIKIYNNTITDNSDDGIHALMCNGLTIQNNTISRSSSAGIFFFTSRNVLVLENKISDNEYGIYLSGTMHTLCKRNEIFDNSWGIWTVYFGPRYNNTITLNNISRNEINVEMRLSIFVNSLDYDTTDSNVLIKNNIVEATKWAVVARWSFAWIFYNWWGRPLIGPRVGRNWIFRFTFGLVIALPCWPEEIAI